MYYPVMKIGILQKVGVPALTLGTQANTTQRDAAQQHDDALAMPMVGVAELGGYNVSESVFEIIVVKLNAHVY
jgi:hypothetical protein